MILIVKHISIEGPGTIGEFLKNTDWETKTVELEKKDKLPETLSGIDGIIVLGGPMNVYEEDRYPFLKDEDIFFKKAINAEIPILGICLGAQLIAKAAGAKVSKAQQKEIGWYDVILHENSKKDPLLEDLDKELKVFQWHEDTFEVPESAILLGTSKSCRNQMFRIGKNAYGLQFHIEVTAHMIKDWSKEYSVKGTQMVDEYYKIKDKFIGQANKIYVNFEKVLMDNFKT
ncbi:MAG: type 1 glutamine amidotransferase [Elusimicrobia bacterium]|nr:type 1 glutamine amidotransferase [Elusimicrobiota bacterium]